MIKFEICNQQFDRCPGCGQYRGQYHSPECPFIEDEKNECDCLDTEELFKMEEILDQELDRENTKESP